MASSVSIHVYLVVILVFYHTITPVRGNVGCFADDAGRLFDTKKAKNSSMSLKKCRQLCQSYTYVGLEGGDECFCGNRLNRQQYPSKPNSQCNKRCSGEHARMCGGTWRISVYKV
ncbi:sialate:O-sulfotransferase 1-like [Mytilus galloprovincialis]|uniref:sialate:O-sulfotransferase 1-like n=1 Tax=Mytilus galloprovincialis TaxID=29158 RepID=UPI003F7C055F